MRIHGMGFAFGPRPGVAGFASAYFMSFSSSGLRRASCSSFFGRDRKSTRLNSSHPSISYAVFCLKKKKYHTLTAALFTIADSLLNLALYAHPIVILHLTSPGSCQHLRATAHLTYRGITYCDCHYL